MYDAEDLLTRLDDHQWPVITVCALAMIGNYIFFISAFRESRRLKIYTIPIFCTLFWYALVLTVTFELIYISQIVRYAGAELLPAATQAQFTALVIAGMVGAVICWEAVKYTMDDPLYAGSFGIANFSYVLMGIALGVRRRSMRGQPPATWLGFLLLAVCWSAANVLWFPDAFREPQWILLHTGSFVGCLALLYASVRWPGEDAETHRSLIRSQRA